MIKKNLAIMATALILHSIATYCQASRSTDLANLGQVYELTHQDALEQLITTGNVIVEFTNPDYCNPCRMIKPVLENLAQQFKEKLLIIVVNTGEFKDLTWKYGVRGIPSLLFYKNGAIVHETSGYKDQGKIIKLINKYFFN